MSAAALVTFVILLGCWVAFLRWFAAPPAAAPAQPVRLRFAFTWGLLRVDIHAWGVVGRSQWLLAALCVVLHVVLCADILRSAFGFVSTWLETPAGTAVGRAVLGAVAGAFTGALPLLLPAVNATLVPASFDAIPYRS